MYYGYLVLLVLIALGVGIFLKPFTHESSTNEELMNSITVPGAPSSDEPRLEPSDRLINLSRYLNTFDYQKVLNNPIVRASLITAAGVNGLEALKANLGVRQPISLMDEHYITLRGLAAHRGGMEEAAIWIDARDASVLAAKLHGGVIVLYGEERPVSKLPRGFLKQIRIMANMGNAPGTDLPNIAIWHQPE